MSKKIYGVIDGIILILLGIYIFTLILQGRYAYYLNPDFLWVTFTSGVFLFILGVFNLFYPSDGSPQHVRIFIYLIILAMCFFVPTKVINESNVMQAPF